MNEDNRNSYPTQQSPSAPQSASRPKRGGGGWMGKAALVCSFAALVIACAALYLVLPKPEPEPEPEPTPQYVTYRGQQLPVLENVAASTYDKEAFQRTEQGWLSYEKDGTAAIPGIDVSYYQGEIDWQAVAGAGVEFAMIRLGYRGYSQGSIQMDSYFERNIQGALDAGIEVGVYFFSQATSVWEAEEEAEFVLDTIKNYDVTYPVAFDWEFITPADQSLVPRTSGMEGGAVTRCAGAFCDMVAAEGYTPVIYFNQDMAYMFYQLERLGDYTFWLAEYNDRPGFYYHFDLWQYTHTGSVPGIEGNVDLNLVFRDFSGKA